jgi:ribosomal protein L32
MKPPAGTAGTGWRNMSTTLRKCDNCGRYTMGGWVYTPWGGYEGEPEERYICHTCFTPRLREVLEMMWHKPKKWGKEDSI